MKFRIISKSVSVFKHQKPTFFQRLRNSLVGHQNNDSFYLEAVVLLPVDLPVNTVFGCKSDVYIVESKFTKSQYATLYTVVPYNPKMTVGINYALYGECEVLKMDNGFFKK